MISKKSERSKAANFTPFIDKKHGRCFVSTANDNPSLAFLTKRRAIVHIGYTRDGNQ